MAAELPTGKEGSTTGKAAKKRLPTEVNIIVNKYSGTPEHLVYRVALVLVVSRSQTAFFRFSLWWLKKEKRKKSGLAMRDYGVGGYTSL